MVLLPEVQDGTTWSKGELSVMYAEMTFKVYSKPKGIWSCFSFLFFFPSSYDVIKMKTLTCRHRNRPKYGSL